MNAQEFAAWTRYTKGSEFSWRLDECARHNLGVLLLCKGGEDGCFVRIERDGKTEAGTYEGAIPHIGEALFKTTFRKTFPNQDDAFARVAECYGTGFLLDLVTTPETIRA